MLKLHNISYNVGKLQIVQDVSMTVQPGEVVVIAGANGAGKSSLLKVACGAIKQSAGTVHIQGKNLKDWKYAQLAQFAAVLQQQNVLTLPFMVKDVVMMGRYPQFKSEPSKADFDIVQDAMKKAGLERFAEKSYLDLSGGEQQRVHLARVFAQIWMADNYETRYLFMDEPSNNLDISHQHNSLKMAREFAAEGNCVIAVLHDLNLAVQYADKILLLKKGNMMAFGTPAEVITERMISGVFDYPLHIFKHEGYGYPIVMPSVNQTLVNL